MSIMARISSTGNDPATVAAAQARITSIARSQIDGTIKNHQGLYTMLGILHDKDGTAHHGAIRFHDPRVGGECTLPTHHPRKFCEI